MKKHRKIGGLVGKSDYYSFMTGESLWKFNSVKGIIQMYLLCFKNKFAKMIGYR